jgi:tetratricopeptide (TPR) repeat protein
LLLKDLLAIGEFKVAAGMCNALNGRSMLPQDASTDCAESESRLGNTVKAAEYLRRLIDASDKAKAFDASLAAADLFERTSRYAAAFPFLKMALDLADPAKVQVVSDLQHRLFVNRLDSGVQAEAVEIAAKITSSDTSGAGTLFVVKEFLAHDKPALAVNAADLLLSRGVRTTEEMGVLVSCYAKMKLPLKAVEVAASCLNLCADVDTQIAASVLSRNSMAAQAAAFADSNVTRFRNQDMVDFETGRLWLAAGEKEKAFERIYRWALADGPVPSAANGGKLDGSRLDYAAGFLLESGTPELVIRLTETGRANGRHFSDELAFYLVRAFCLKNDWVLAQKAAEDALGKATRQAELGLKLATLFFDFKRNEAAVRMLGFLTAEGGNAPAVKYSRHAYVLLLRAKLISRGALKGDIDAELINALDIAAGDPAIISDISKFVETIQPGVDLAVAVAENVAVVKQDDPSAMKTLAEVYLANGRTMAAADALALYVDASQDREKALTEGLERLLGDRLYNEALWLVGSKAGGRKLPPAVAIRISEACLEVGERSCVATWLETFLSGPVSDDYDYVALAERLASAGFYDLTEKTLGVARRVSGTDGLWREALMRGRLALFRNDKAAAEKAYLVALKEAPSRARILMAIGADYAGIGDINGALNWVGMGVSDRSEQVRGQVFPTWADTMRRLGRASEVTIKPLENVSFQSFAEVKDALDILVDIGRADLAGKLLHTVKLTLPSREKGEFHSKRLDLFCALRDRVGAVAAADAVCNWSAAADGAGCADACSRLIDAGYGVEAMALLKKASDKGLVEATVLLALHSLTVDNIATAEKAALKAAASVSDPISFVRRLWSLYPSVAGRASWVKVLDVLLARPEFSANQALIVESGVSRLTVSGGTDGMDRVRRYAVLEKGNVIQAFKALISAGWFEQARALLAETSPNTLADMKAADLAFVIETFKVRGFGADADAFVSRYLMGGEDSTAARASLASALLGLGDTDGALKLFAAVSASGMTAESRFDYGTALWKKGDRKAAMEQFKSVIAVGGEDSSARTQSDRATSDRRRSENGSSTNLAVLGFLDSENALLEMAEFLDSVEKVTGISGRLLYSRARVEAALPGDAHLLKARNAVFAALKGARYLTLRALGGEHDDVIEYARTEARRGSVADLAVRALEYKGAAYAQLALFSACLAGDQSVVRAAVSKIIPAEVQGNNVMETGDSADVLIVAKLMFECGRWDDAADFAMRYLRSSPLNLETIGVGVSIAVQSFTAAGRKNLVTDEFLAGLTGDEVVRSGIRAIAATTVGDYVSDAAAKDRGARLVRQNVGVTVEAFEAKVRATDSGPGGDAGLAGYAAELQGTLAWPTREADKFSSRLSGAFRFAAASEYLKKQGALNADSVSALLNLFRASVDNGDVSDALQTATRLVEALPDPSRTMAGLIGYASAALRRDVVVDLVSMVIADRSGKFKGSLDSDLISAVIGASWFLHQTGVDGDLGYRFLVASRSWARDGALFCGSLVASFYANNDCSDMTFHKSVSAMFENGSCTSPELKDRLSDFRLFVSGRPADMSRIKTAIPVDEKSRLMIVAARSAIVQGRFDDATGWYTAAAMNSASRAGKVAIVSDMVNYLGDQTGVPAEQRSRMARMGLDAVKSDGDVLDDGRYAPLSVQLLEMTDGVHGAVKFMENEIRLDPSAPGSHNNIAYVLSIRTSDRKRFQSEIELALAFSGADRGSYMDTEAWGLHLYGNKGAGLKLQTGASALWNSSGRSGLAECFNHYGMMLEDAGKLKDAVEMYRRSVVYGESWDWHSILSLRKLRSHGFFK